MTRLKPFKLAENGTVLDVATAKLYVFDRVSVTVFKGWPDPMAWRKTEERPFWRNVRPERIFSVPRGRLDDRIDGLRQRLAEPLELGGVRGELEEGDLKAIRRRRKDREQLPWLEFFDTFPRWIRDCATRYPERQWHMICLLSRCGPPAKDLVRSNPAIAFMLASNWVFHEPAVSRPIRASRSLLVRKQKEILAWLGFPGTQAVRRILAKVQYKAIRIVNLLYLRQAMHSPAALKVMSHLPRLNLGALRIISDPSLLPFAAPSLLEEIAARGGEDKAAASAYELRDVLNMFGLLNGDQRRTVRVRSRLALRDIHDSLVQQLNRANRAGFVPFPEPPLPGSAEIVPITNSRELAKEGSAQHNCVVSYVKRIALDGGHYVYRVLAPERATLLLTCRRGGWSVTELKTACNGQPKGDTWTAVRTWFEGAQKGAPPKHSYYRRAGNGGQP